MNNQTKKTYHGLHLILSILTGMLWIPIWIWRTLSNSQHNRQVQISLLEQQLEEIKRGNDRK